MTGGQYSPLTPTAAFGTTAPYGNIDPVFDICKIADAAGASYVARGTAFHTQMLIDLIKKGMENKGFSLIESLSGCPTYFGRRNKLANPVDLMKHLKDITLNVKAAEKLPPEKKIGKILIGEFKNEARPEYTCLLYTSLASTR